MKEDIEKDANKRARIKCNDNTYSSDEFEQENISTNSSSESEHDN